MTVGSFNETDPIKGLDIVMFDGLLSDIPNGWVICDGNNGTPDLRDRFVKQTSSSTNSPYSSSGQHTFAFSTSQMPSHNHDGSTDTSSDHSHTQPFNESGYGSNSYDNNPYYTSIQDSNVADYEGTGGGGHSTHGYSIGNSGGTAEWENRPAYYEVAFIARA